MKDAIINARIESSLKKEVENILKKIGINATDAINIFYQQIKLNKGLPFEVRIPNKETIKAIEEARLGIELENITIEELATEAKKCMS